MLSRIVLIVLFAAGPASAQTVVVRNVHGYALQPSRVESFSTLVIVNGKVDRLLGAEVAVPSLPNAVLIDARGQTLLPGLIDAHGHVSALGQLRLQADLRGSSTVNAALDRVRKFANDNRSATWVVGSGWNQVLWPDKKFPTAVQLDAVVPDRPALLSRIDGHAVWVNSAALKLAAITRTTADPSGGQILRDAAGNPTGVLVDNATALVMRLLPPKTDADATRALSTALNELASVGLTGVHDAGIDSTTYRLYEELGKQNRLPVRVYAMLADSEAAREVIKSGPKQAQFEDRLQMRAVKARADGALGSRGAAFLEDYSDQAGHRGLALNTEASLTSLAQLTARYGWQLNVHAIGDAAIRTTLNAFEHGLTSAQRQTLRPRIEHAQVIALTDLPRFAALNVIASIQPTHATSDMNMAEDRIGAQRMQGAYAWRKLKSAGVRLAGGSDFPVELPNPIHGLYAAVTRKGRDGKPPGGWYAQEKLSREEALRLFTADAAYAGHMEDRVGTLQPGQWADFILIDRDFLTVAEDQIDDTKVTATYVAGKKVWPQ
jgi:predicted amidohydrolase YtcJ